MALEDNMKSILIIKGEKDFKNYRGNGINRSLGARFLFKARSSSLFHEYSVGDSIVLGFKTIDDREIMKAILEEKEINYNVSRSSNYNEVCLQESIGS